MNEDLIEEAATYCSARAFFWLGAPDMCEGELDVSPKALQIADDAFNRVCDDMGFNVMGLGFIWAEAAARLLNGEIHA